MNLISYANFFFILIFWILISVVSILVLGQGAKPRGHKLKAVIIYAATIFILFISTINYWILTQLSLSSVLAILGSLSFLFSDGLIAFNEFRHETKNAKIMTETSYVFAHICLQGSFLLVWYYTSIEGKANRFTVYATAVTATIIT